MRPRASSIIGVQIATSPSATSTSGVMVSAGVYREAFRRASRSAALQACRTDGGSPEGLRYSTLRLHVAQHDDGVDTTGRTCREVAGDDRDDQYRRRGAEEHRQV